MDSFMPAAQIFTPMSPTRVQIYSDTQSPASHSRLNATALVFDMTRGRRLSSRRGSTLSPIHFTAI